MQPFRRLLVCVAALLVSVFIAFAQTETGQITGTVSDPSGAGVPNATVTAKSPTTGVARSTKSFGTGVYTLTDLLPGPYDVSVTAEGFNKVQQRVTVAVGARVGQDFRLEVGTASTVVEVSGTATTVDTETQTLSQVVTGNEIRELPNLTRNPYQFVALAGNASDGGMGTRGAGFSINGQRESSTNLLLDGAANNDEFNGNIGQQVPLDALQEFSVLTSNFTAEYGRAAGGIVNVVTKAGTNEYHGTAYEFNRVSSLSSNSFQNNALGVPEAVFVRNQFGYSTGGPVKKNKLFFFSSTEWTRVRSNATQFAWVADPALLALTPANTQNFFSTLGGLRASASVIGTVNLNQVTALNNGSNPCTPAGKPPLLCASLPPTTALFDHVTYSVPFDAGGGTPQNTYNMLHRMDYNISDNTQLYARYALYSEVDQSGALSNSPYSGYDLGQSFFNHNALVSVIHTFSPRWVSQSKVVYNRLTNLQEGYTAARGIVPTMYANTTGAVPIGTDNIAFPGYNPFTPGNGGAFGGPQNILQFYEDMTFTKGGHSLRFGVTYDNMRDNRTYAAYQTAVDALSKGGIGPSLSGLLAGTFTDIKAAVNPQGQFPGGTVTLPLGPPSFSRSNRFHDGAAYVQDSWKVKQGITVNLGLRWEYFGVQHNANQALDSNWYAPGIAFADPSLAQYLSTGTIQMAQKSSVGAMWDPSKKNFAPRIGFAWDIFGDGKTSFRAGYGIGYERNFGNVTFNLIQNPPNYAVLDVPGAITTANFGPLGGSGGTLNLPHVGARIVDPNIKTAYAHIWSASIERQVTKDVVYSLEYSGSKGVNLYTISYPNQGGFGNNNLGIPCTGNGDCTAQPNSNWGANVGYRGNEGFSIYHGLNNKLTVRNFKNTGLDLSMNYTWSHAIDNQSSTFFEAAGVQGQYGNSNITTNNGNFGLGLLDPFHPNLDRGDAEFDLRQRVTMAANWRVPFRGKGIAGKLLGGWSLNPLFVAHTGQPYSIFNCESPLTLNYNCERAVFNGPIPRGSNGLVATATPDSYNWLTLTQAQINMDLTNPMTPGSPWPSSMSGRDAFRAPGWWNLDFGVFKDTKITERFSLQLRGELFNLFNHANLYVVGNSADAGAATSITACYGCTGSTYDRRNMQLAAKLIF